MNDDRHLFHKAMAGVRPLKARRLVVPSPPSMRRLLREKGIQPSRELPPPRPMTALAPLSTERAPGLDRATATTLRRGRLVPDGTLDLHGMTLLQAERALEHCLARGQSNGWRSVLVVTGKGVRLEDGSLRGGRIRAHLVEWLNLPHNRLRVHAVRQAHPRHGGEGAFYVLLRRAG